MAGLPNCPRCGQGLAGEPVCPRCGVVFAKLRPRDPAEAARESTGPAVPSQAPVQGAPLPWALILGFAALMIAGVVGLPRLRSGPIASPAPDAAAVRRDGASRASAAAEPAPPPLAELPPVAEAPIQATVLAAKGDPDEDRIAAFATRLMGRAPMGSADVQAVEDLLARRSGEPAIRQLASAVLMAAADQERGRRRFAQAIAYLDRATVVDPGNTRPWLGLMTVALDVGDWTRAEAAARGALAIDANLMEAWYRLGYALMRQDRNTEAVEALRTAVAIRPDANAQALLERLLAGMATEKGMTEQQLAHFHVRYDGDEHVTVGREILRALERHYATLTSALAFEPSSTIPVILYSRESYHVSGGSPHALGHFDTIDGRIRVPIQGFSGVTSDLDDTLLHELTHAFTHERTRGVAPRFPMHEGLAQYMAGRRVDSQLSSEQLGWLADGRIGGTQGAYLESLSFVEYLVGSRGMGGINDLLRIMGETGNVDEAFQQVHGQSAQATMKAWRQRIRQQHGS